MKILKLDSINKKISFLVSIIITLSLLGISLFNYMVSNRELNRSNHIILENAIESTLFEINRNYDLTLEDNRLMTVEDAKALSLESINSLSWNPLDGTSGATSETMDGLSGATKNSGFKYHTLNLGESGYFFIIDSQGGVLSHPFLEDNIFELQSKDGRFIFQEMIAAAKEGGGVLNYDLPDGTSRIPGKQTVYTRYFPHWDWIITAVIYDSELQRGSSIILNYNMICLVLILFISLLVTVMLTMRITKPIKAISHTLQEVSEGNLAVGKINIKAKDETKLLGDSVNTLIDKFQSVVHMMMTSSNNLNQYSNELKQSADTVSVATTEVTKAITQMSEASEEQFAQTSNSVNRINQLGKDIQETAQASAEIEKVAKKALELKETGDNSVNELKDASYENNQNSNAIEDVVNEINDHALEIDSIVDIISGVAKRINLLALNANIVAAGAGEHGRGFAVVANEIRKLANETAISTEDIRQKINETQSKSKSAVDFVLKNKSGVSKINQTVIQTETVFSQMATELEMLIEGINQIASYNYAINHKKDDVLEMLRQVSYIAEDNSASIQEISATAEEQSSIVLEITDNISHLNDMVSELNSIINKFKI